MAPLEPWEKVFIDLEDYSEDIHSSQPCEACHSGVQAAAEKADAHQGLVARPSENAEAVCGACHSGIVETYASSLHNTQAGYWTMINLRSEPQSEEDHAALETMFGNHCANCHTTCGDCHVSQPSSVGGGLIDSHIFNKTPSITRNCTACHGSRVGNEYMGKNEYEGVLADVHFRQGRMKCSDCHTATEMHGAVELAEDEIPHRYAGEEEPACKNCHDITTGSNTYHQMHGETLSCQVCHSVTYSSCDGCHVSISEETGMPKFATEGTYATFYIGRNTRLSEERPYLYVPVRHVPIVPDSYAFYGENLLESFNALPTWVYATPHNIQLQTPQNSSCDACHNNADLFLTADKVAPEELEANKDVIVEELPGN